MSKKFINYPQSKGSPVLHPITDEFIEEPMNSLEEVGVKYDEGKTLWHLLPIEGAEDMLKVMEYGAKKYGDYNWYLGMDWHRLFNAGIRHLTAWWRGEEKDPESGLPHLAHASCCVLMLSSLVLVNRGKDTRPK